MSEIEQRRGPKAGYDFPEKERHRQMVWRHFACWRPNPLHRAEMKVAFLPSSEGAEIPLALELGFKAENLVAIDANPAVLATAKWRATYPEVRCYGSELGRAMERIACDGVCLDAANLDLCSNLSEPQLDELSRAAASGAFNHECTVAITVLKGREQEHFSTLLERLGPPSLFPPRLSVPVELFKTKFASGGTGFGRSENENESACRPVIWDEYRSQTQTMLFGIFQISKIDAIAKRNEQWAAWQRREAYRRQARAPIVRGFRSNS